MKIFVGKKNSCNLNYQHFYIYGELADKFEITENVKEADAIVLTETCVCTEFNLTHTLSYIMDILKEKKDNAKIYLTGCMSRKFLEKESLIWVEEWLKKNIDYIIPQNQPNLLLKLISEQEFIDENIYDFGMVDYYSGNYADIYISNGCLNDCSFCKLTFQEFPLKSVDFDELKNSIDYLDENNYKNIRLLGTNISQYGLDNYNKYLLPEVIDYIESKKNIERVSLIGFAFQDAIKNDFQDVIRNSKKISLISGALESGSDRLLELIRKGFTSDEFINFCMKIRELHNKRLLLNIIAGFPTETMDDVKKTLNVLEELKPNTVDICRYTNSSFIDSSQYEQLNPEVIQEHARIYSRVLKKRNVKVYIRGNGYKYN